MGQLAGFCDEGVYLAQMIRATFLVGDRPHLLGHPRQLQPEACRRRLGKVRSQRPLQHSAGLLAPPLGEMKAYGGLVGCGILWEAAQGLLRHLGCPCQKAVLRRAMREAELDKIGGGFWRLGMRLDGLLQQRHGGLFPLEIQGELCDVRHEFWLARIPLQEAQVVRQGIADLSRSFEIPGRQVMSQRHGVLLGNSGQLLPRLRRSVGVQISQRRHGGTEGGGDQSGSHQPRLMLNLTAECIFMTVM